MRATEFTNRQQPILEGKHQVQLGDLVLHVYEDGQDVNVRVMNGDRQVGYVIFLRDGKLLIPDDLSVDEEYRGRGIAKKMYDYVKSLGFKIIRSGVQTNMGKRFWDKNRGEHVDVWEEESLREASSDWRERNQAESKIVNLIKSKESWLDFDINDINELKKLVKITGRAATIYGQGTAGSVLDKMIHYYRLNQAKSGQMPQFAGVASTATDMAQQIAIQTNGQYYRKFGRTWITGYGQRYKEPNDYIEYKTEDDYDSAWQWVESKGKKVYYYDSFKHLNTAIKIGKYIVEPASVIRGAFSDAPVTTHALSVRTAAVINQSVRQQADISDQQAEALKDIASTKNQNAIEGIKRILSVLQGEQDIKNIIDNSKKIDSRDKAKLDAIIAGAKNFNEPDSGISEDTVNNISNEGAAETAPGLVTFAGRDPNEFKSPKGGKPVMVIQTEQGSRYLITSDGMVLRHKSVHANTGGEDAGLKDWSDKIEFYDRSKPLIAGGMQPLSFPDAVAHLADQGRIALSTGKSGARVAVILDNGNWRPATIADAMPKAAAAKPEWAKIVIKADAGTWGSQPKLGWQPLDYNQRGDGTLNRVHNGSPVSHGAKVAQGVAEAAQNDLSTIIQSFVASPAGQKYKQHDCKTVTRAFVAWAEQNKITTQVVSLAPPSAEFIAKNPRYKGKSGQGDGHIMPIVNGNAIDFTVRQFGVGRPFENPLITPTNSLPAVYGKFGYFTDKPEWFLGGKSHWIGSLNSIPSEIFNQNFGDELLEQGVAEAWSEKYKKSINCKNPKGFSQRAHCQGRKKNNEQVELDERKRKRKKKADRYFYGPAYVYGTTDAAVGGDAGGLEEDWKKSLTNIGLAGAIGLGAAGGLELKDKIKSAFTKPTAQTTQTAQPTKKPQLVQVSPITNNPLEMKLLDAAKKSGLHGLELAQFLGQCAHETLDYKRMIERGNKKYFNKYEPRFAPKKARILGNVKPGDGERYKGRGYIQLTGRYNYKAAGEALNLPLEQNPELAAQPEIAAQIALWYWGQRVKPEVQDFADTTSVTRKINPGLSGLEDRHENFLSYIAQR